MTHIQHLADRIACARAYFATRERRDIMESVHQLVEAAAACGDGVTLNVPQAAALRVYLDSVIALRETRVIEAAAAAEPPTNVIRFSAN